LGVEFCEKLILERVVGYGWFLAEDVALYLELERSLGGNLCRSLDSSLSEVNAVYFCVRWGNGGTDAEFCCFEVGLETTTLGLFITWRR
jgi:hypothetical protein